MEVISGVPPALPPRVPPGLPPICPGSGSPWKYALTCTAGTGLARRPHLSPLRLCRFPGIAWGQVDTGGVCWRDPRASPSLCAARPSVARFGYRGTEAGEFPTQGGDARCGGMPAGQFYIAGKNPGAVRPAHAAWPSGLMSPCLDCLSDAEAVARGCTWVPQGSASARGAHVAGASFWLCRRLVLQGQPPAIRTLLDVPRPQEQVPDLNLKRSVWDGGWVKK
jgi:hypothetical protein